MDNFREVMIWKRLDASSAVRYSCLHDIKSGRYAVQSEDFFRLPLEEKQFRYFEMQFVELLIETSPFERCKWFDSLEIAIAAHNLDFSRGCSR